MNPWARRHRQALEAGLEPGEQLLAADRVVRAKSVRLSTLARSGATPGHDRLAVARPDLLPFAVPRSVFVLGFTDRRMVLWRATTALARPRAVVSSWKVSGIAAVTATRPFLTTRLVILLDDGSQLVVRPTGSRNLRPLAAAFAEAKAQA